MRTAGVKMKDIPDMLGQQISLGVGRQYTPLSAVRGSIEIGRYAYQHGGVYPLSVTADYMLNLTNMIVELRICSNARPAPNRAKVLTKGT